ncbi:hypothetical protein SAMN06265348_111147 [Pedobacter westerhofensis]|uniref:Uncharacterized protein n=1 Tax=Pedobacter westerhofensis TaxID=425512 RepID=A0A521FEX1_9SPHI|nr:hypothetical protein [Pedobacter westerhofensis]SMO94090.1 hypothetical protein SAMN06265348_111147 [Pedobacter westerhofensis]
MENKTADNTKSPLTTEPVLVNAIIETLSKEVEQIKELLSKKNLLEEN